MTDELLKIANEINRKIKKFDDEIYSIMDLTPTVRSNTESFLGRLRWRGRTVKLSASIHFNTGKKEYEMELSNEDCRALIDIRTAEREQLKQLLMDLGENQNEH